MRFKKIIAGVLSLATLTASLPMGQTGAFVTAMDFGDESRADEETYPATSGTYTYSLEESTEATESDVTLGDVNDDGMINSIDAVDVLQYYADELAGNEQFEINIEAADVNKDGKVTTKDAYFILVHYAYAMINEDMPFDKMIMKIGNTDYTVDISVENVEVLKSQKIIEIPVIVSSIPDDDGVVSSAIRYTVDAGTLSCPDNISSSNGDTLVVARARASKFNDSQMYTLKYELPSDAEVGDVYDITPYVEELSNIYGEDVPFNLTAGKVTVVNEKRPTLKIGKAYPVEGSDVIAVSVRISGDISSSSLDVSLDIDSKLELAEVESVIGSSTFGYDNVVSFNFSSDDCKRYYNEKICTLYFESKSDLSAGEKFTISGNISYDGESTAAESGLITVISESEKEVQVSYDHSDDKETVIEVAKVKVNEAAIGTTIDIPVMIFNNPGYQGTGISYIASAGIFDWKITNGLSEPIVAITTQGDVISLSSAEEKDITDDGALYILKYIVPDDAKVGDVIDIKANLSMFANAAGEDVEAKIYGGSVTIADPSTPTETESQTEPTTPSIEISYGDVNVDGKIGIADAVLLNKYLVNSATLSDTSKLNADCNKDGDITPDDTLTLLKYLVGTITEF